MTIAEQLEALRGVKADLKDAITGKGGDLTDVAFPGYGDAVRALPDDGISLESMLGLEGADEWELISDAPLDISRFMFWGNRALARVDLENATGTTLAGGFRELPRLRSLRLPRVTAFGNYACVSDTALESVDLPALTTVGTYAFQYCTSLREVSLPMLATAGSVPFQGCTSLEVVNLPALKAVPANCFQNCSALREVSLPLAQTTVGQYAFAGCTSLERLDLPGAFSLIDTYAFQNASSLRALILRSRFIPSLASTAVFAGTPIAGDKTGYIYVPDDLVDAYKAASVWKAIPDQIRPLSELPE